MSPPADGTAPVRVLVADDQKVVRDGLVLMLGLVRGVEVVGTAVDGADAVRQVATLDPDVVLMDLRMPTLDGVAATRALTDQGARARVVVLTTYADDDSVFGALRAGARGFLTKDAGAEEIRWAVLTVASGNAQLDPSVQRRLLEALASGAHVGVPAPELPRVDTSEDGLTAREEDVLAEIARGLTNSEVAATLFVSEATVKTHVNHLLAKTGCRDRAAHVAYAYRTGRVTPSR
jgi:DNA-binding NarL/FixJ family response regulator